MTAQAADPSLSVIFAATDPWPAAAICLEPLAQEMRDSPDVATEVVVAASHENVLPPEGHELWDTARWIVDPGASVFALRSQALQASSGKVVAITEDHCAIPHGWLRDLIHAHEHGETSAADVVVPMVENGSAVNRIDCANFLLTFASSAPPRVDVDMQRMPPVVGASFQREKLGTIQPQEGWLETVWMPTAFARRGFRMDPRSRVSHVQSHGVHGTIACHFNNGRATTGLARPHMSLRDWARRLLFLPAAPVRIVRETRRAVADRPLLRRQWSRSWYLVALLSVMHSFGEAAGLILGPGDSPDKLA